jgi:hypothetical protein
LNDITTCNGTALGLDAAAGGLSQIARLNALLLDANASKEALRQEHAAALAARDRDLREAQERHAAQEKRMLADVDCARQAAKHLEGDLVKEQQRRLRGEEAAALLLEGEREALRQAREAAHQTERGLRDQLSAQAIALAQSHAQGTALAHSVEELQIRLAEEQKSHEATRGLLAGALAAVRKINARRPPPGKAK